MSQTDVIIPLGNGSSFGNDELRILLRSIERNLIDVGNVFIASDCAPEWIQNCVVVNCADIYKHNKDANMIRKVVHVLNNNDVSKKFILCSDDNVFMARMTAEEIPVLYNNRTRKNFSENSVWHERMRHTFDFAAKKGFELNCNFESHTPQVFSSNIVRSKTNYEDYVICPGLAIYTYFRLLEGITTGIDQRTVKSTHETFESSVEPFGSIFCGYNDLAFFVLRNRLFKMFSEKSHYEKD